MNNGNILSVSEITRKIKSVLENGFSNVLIRGEISNFKLHSSGHAYFTLKDETSQISAVMWRNRVQQMLFKPSDGMKIVARGNITVYEPRGNYQLDCANIQPLGIGELQAAFEKLKKKLFDEGLFDEQHKKELPLYPGRIAIITSPTGAAIHDILSVIGRRMPSVEVTVVPVKVQGMGAAEEIAAAVNMVNELRLADVMIVGRGGGSLEDLWAFNEEIVARSVFSSAIPVISAVGHEIDFSICDFVADLRAPTPSVAAELAVKDKSELIEIIGNICYTMTASMTQTIRSHTQTIEHLIHSYSFNRPQELFKQQSQRLDELIRRLDQSMQMSMRIVVQQIKTLTGRMKALDPHIALRRGFAIVRQQGHPVSAAARIQENADAEVEFYDGIAVMKVLQKEIRNAKKR
jgi:exodeoxyribonuclease VII large subunit